MRTFFVLLVAGFTATISASAPLSNKEITLMLRSGYSSGSVLREIASRRVLERLDPLTKKSLLEFNASPQLIRALETGDFAASAAEADAAQKEQADRAARVARQHTTLPPAPTPAVTASPPAGSAIANAFTDKLVRCRDGTINRAEPEALTNKKLIAFYYSAHWCPPCRKFTPALVEYYNRVVAEHPEFEIIFVSSDKSRFNWETYIRETKMPWLAIDYDQLAGFDSLRRLGGNSIPSLLVLDESGHLVASSYEGDKYIGPQNSLAALDKIFAQKAATPLAQAR